MAGRIRGPHVSQLPLARRQPTAPGLRWRTRPRTGVRCRPPSRGRTRRHSVYDCSLCSSSRHHSSRRGLRHIRLSCSRVISSGPWNHRHRSRRCHRRSARVTRSRSHSSIRRSSSSRSRLSRRRRRRRSQAPHSSHQIRLHHPRHRLHQRSRTIHQRNRIIVPPRGRRQPRCRRLGGAFLPSGVSTLTSPQLVTRNRGRRPLTRALGPGLSNHSLMKPNPKRGGTRASSLFVYITGRGVRRPPRAGLSPSIRRARELERPRQHHLDRRLRLYPDHDPG